MFKNYKLSYLKNDILSGIIVALVSIPISMGYAQVAGLPVQYGLYASILPVLLFGILSSSPQFVFGVDATPAALVGGCLATLEISTGSEEAMRIVPVITLLTAIWLFIFFIIKAGRLVNYISTPVMGGFISGIGCTIILMQISKLFGGDAGTGEVIVLIIHIANQIPKFNLVSAILGFGTTAIILIAKKHIPKFPMSVFMLIIGMGATAVFDLSKYGVKLLPEVEAGLPSFVIPDVKVLFDNGQTLGKDLVILSFSIALVIVAQTLLATNNYALKNDYKININREVLAYSVANISSAALGSCPLNGSVSRTGIAAQFGSKSQMMSVVSAFTMLGVVLFGTGTFKYMPVPVLTGIVIAALIGILEFGLAKKLFATNKNEFFIFMGAFAGVLLFGTIYGVVIGVILSFVAVIIKAVVPPKAFLGVIPGHDGFFSLKRNKNAKKVKGAVIYRFSGNLFFANINTFQDDIESAISDDTKCVIIDGSGIGNIDVTAADRLLIMNKKLKNRGINLYLTEHVGTVNDQLRKLGAGSLVEEGHVRRTVSLALRAQGIDKPYPLEGVSDTDKTCVETNEHLAELEWAFGEEADNKMEQLAKEVAVKLADNLDNIEEYSIETIKKAEDESSWAHIGLFDEDELLDRLEMHLKDMSNVDEDNTRLLEEKLEQRRSIVENKLQNLNPEALDVLKKHRKQVAMHLKESNPEAYEHIIMLRKEHIVRLEKVNPKLAAKMKKLYENEEWWNK